jgi:hypothetical protein
LQLANETSVIGYINFMQSKVYTYSPTADAADKDPNVSVDYSGLLQLAPNPATLVNELNLLLAAGQLSAATISTINNAISQITDNLNNRVYAAILLVMASPEFIVTK